MGRGVAALAFALALVAGPAAAEPLSLLDQDMGALAERLTRANVDLGVAPAVTANPAARRSFIVVPPAGAGPQNSAATEGSRRVMRGIVIEAPDPESAEPTAREVFRARDRRLLRRPPAAVLIDPGARRLLR